MKSFCFSNRGVGNSNPLQYSCLGNPMHRGGWWATVAKKKKKKDNKNTKKESRKNYLKHWGVTKIRQMLKEI